MIRSSGKLIEVVEVDYKRNVMGGMRWTHEWVRDAEQTNREFLFLIEKYASQRYERLIDAYSSLCARNL